MDEAIIDGNCGELCNYHCCRSHEGEEDLGMYLLPLEYECMQQGNNVPFEIHTSYQYDLPKSIKKQYYIFCSNDSGCLRDDRPIQCRTYPLEPHLENGKLSLIVEKDQLHGCPLLSSPEKWRKEFIKGTLKAWTLLITIDEVKVYVKSISDERIKEGNISYVVI